MKKINYCDFYDLEDKVLGYVWAEPFKGFYVIKKGKWKKACEKCLNSPRFLSDKPVLVLGLDISYRRYEDFRYEEKEWDNYL